MLSIERILYVCLVDLLWERLRSIAVSPRMPAAVQSLYDSGTLSMKIVGTAGQPALQRMGVRQSCPLTGSPTLFGIFFDGFHEPDVKSPKVWLTCTANYVICQVQGIGFRVMKNAVLG